MVEKDQRSREDRRKDTDRRKFNDPYSHLPNRRKTPCRRFGKDRRINEAKEK